MIKTDIIEDVRPVLIDCFSADQALLDKWHVEAPAILHECVERTMADLKEARNYVFYKIYDEEKTIGFFGTENIDGSNFLTGFFIKPEFRTKEVKNYMWHQIKYKFSNDMFFSAIYSKNERAAKFLEKQGGVKVPVNKEEYLLFKFN